MSAPAPGGRRGLRIGEPGEERRPHLLDARDLRLLQHHLGDEHRPPVTRRAPRQGVATVRRVPAGQRGGL